jgi:hypothetical protein
VIAKQLGVSRALLRERPSLMLDIVLRGVPVRGLAVGGGQTFLEPAELPE